MRSRQSVNTEDSVFSAPTTTTTLNFAMPVLSNNDPPVPLENIAAVRHDIVQFRARVLAMRAA